VATPAARGFGMPAEWAPHRGTWLSWPHKAESWPGRFGPVPGVFARIVAALVPHEEVHVNAGTAALEASARAALAAHGVPDAGIFFHRHPTNDCWCRDHGPVYLQRARGGRREEMILDWGYNAWGGKYPPYDLDDAIPARVAAEYRTPVESPGIVLEGGSIDVNGEGTLLTTEQCLLNPNRNPGLGKADLERRLRDFLGVRHILWLGEGIEGDDTDGHVDDLTRFVDPRTVVTAVEDDPRDANFAPLRDNLERLRRMTDQDGRPLRIVELPMPPALYEQDQRLPASYANFYIANGVVLLPGYDPARDALARAALQPLFPGRAVVVIDCRDLVWGLGAIHCVTQQWPAL
jgi:agmatine deiminase